MAKDKFKGEIDFLKDGPWDELYAIAQHWKSDLAFYKDDLQFLHHLIDKYLVWIVREENAQLVTQLKNKLLSLKTRNKDLTSKINKHCIQLGRMVEDFQNTHGGISQAEHAHLEAEMAQFVKSFRENKRETFKLTEYIMDSEALADIFSR